MKSIKFKIYILFYVLIKLNRFNIKLEKIIGQL